MTPNEQKIPIQTIIEICDKNPYLDSKSKEILKAKMLRTYIKYEDYPLSVGRESFEDIIRQISEMRNIKNVQLYMIASNEKLLKDFELIITTMNGDVNDLRWPTIFNSLIRYKYAQLDESSAEMITLIIREQMKFGGLDNTLRFLSKMNMFKTKKRSEELEERLMKRNSEVIDFIANGDIKSSGCVFCNDSCEIHCPMVVSLFGCNSMNHFKTISHKYSNYLSLGGMRNDYKLFFEMEASKFVIDGNKRTDEIFSWSVVEMIVRRLGNAKDTFTKLLISLENS
jgi:hypothetical protein